MGSSTQEVRVDRLPTEVESREGTPIGQGERERGCVLLRVHTRGVSEDRRGEGGTDGTRDQGVYEDQFDRTDLPICTGK